MVQPVWSVHSNTARVPVRLDNARFLFKSDHEVTIPPREIRTVSTGIGFTIPHNIGVLVYPVVGIYSLHYPRFIKSTHGTALEIKVINLTGDQPITIEAGQDLLRMLCQRTVNPNNFTFNRLNENAIEPIRHPDSIGWILKSPTALTIEPNSSEIVDTGVSTPGIPGYNVYVYPLHEFCTSNYFVDDEESLRIRLMNCTQSPLNIDVGDDLGLITLNEAVHLEFEDVQEFPARLPLSPINRRG